MSSDNERALLEEIFKLFPNASIVVKFDKSEITHPKALICKNGRYYYGLVKFVKPPRSVLRTNKQRISDCRRWSFSYRNGRGGI
jgi:hypothetical protein